MSRNRSSGCCVGGFHSWTTGYVAGNMQGNAPPDFPTFCPLIWVCHGLPEIGCPKMMVYQDFTVLPFKYIEIALSGYPSTFLDTPTSKKLQKSWFPHTVQLCKVLETLHSLKLWQVPSGAGDAERDPLQRFLCGIPCCLSQLRSTDCSLLTSFDHPTERLKTYLVYLAYSSCPRFWPLDSYPMVNQVIPRLHLLLAALLQEPMRRPESRVSLAGYHILRLWDRT